MKQEKMQGEYDALIRRIQRMRKWIIALAVIGVIAVFFGAAPIHIELSDGAVFETKGLSPGLTVLLLLFVLIIEAIAYAIVSAPTTTSMDLECDPQKYLALNAALTKGKLLPPIFASGHFCAGNIPAAMDFSAQMIASGKPGFMKTGLFIQARCQFVIENYEAMKVSVQQFESLLSAAKKVDPVSQKYHDILRLLCAVAEGDREKIEALRNSIQVWKKSKPVEGYVNYIKGVAAYHVGDRQESIYRFMTVKHHCEKTVYARIANEYLQNLK